jgi:phosphatidylglycerophosphate synthase
MHHRLKILLYVPNVIGYARLLMIISAFHICINDSFAFLALYALQALLDGMPHPSSPAVLTVLLGVDGYAARALGQSSAFGAWVFLFPFYIAVSTSKARCGC